MFREKSLNVQRINFEKKMELWAYNSQKISFLLLAPLTEKHGRRSNVRSLASHFGLRMRT